MSTSQQALDSSGARRAKATFVGAVAVLLWSSLAPLTAIAHGIPPFELLAATFGIGYLCGQIWLRMRGRESFFRKPKYPASYGWFATTALFGYHAFYFVALSLAPPAQASLVAYLWPLLIVLLSAAINLSERIRFAHIAGAVLGFAGTALLVWSRDSDHAVYPYRSLGLLAALFCVLVWSIYSVFNRRFREVPSEAMIDICGLVAMIGCGVHLLMDSHTVVPQGSQWFAMAALGACYHRKATSAEHRAQPWDIASASRRWIRTSA